MNAVPPPVSIVIPARDEPAHLPRALESVQAQDYRGAIEVIVADGSETPDMADIVRARFPEVRIVPNPARHIPGGLNAALGAASHEFVLRCDARCDLPRDYVRKAVATLVRTGAAAAGGRQVPVGDSPFTRAVALAMTLPLGAGDARYRIGGREGPADTVWPGAYRRGALLAAGGFDESLRRNEDYALHWKLRELGHTVWFDPDLHAGYRPRGKLPGARPAILRQRAVEVAHAAAPSALAARPATRAPGAAARAGRLRGARRRRPWARAPLCRARTRRFCLPRRSRAPARGATPAPRSCCPRCSPPCTWRGPAACSPPSGGRRGAVPADPFDGPNRARRTPPAPLVNRSFGALGAGSSRIA